MMDNPEIAVKEAAADGLTSDEIDLLRALLHDAGNGVGRTVEAAMSLLRRGSRLFSLGFARVKPRSEVIDIRDDFERNSICITPFGRACVVAILSCRRGE